MCREVAGAGFAGDMEERVGRRGAGILVVQTREPDWDYILGRGEGLEGCLVDFET